MSDVTKTDLMRLSARITDAETDIAAIEAASSGLTPAQVTDLTDAGESALHYHSSDRDRASHTGTQAESSLALTDVTTNDVSTSAHGFAPKAVAPAAGLVNVYGIANGETAITNKPLFDATVPSTQAFGDAAATGSATVSARRDHKHAMMATPTATTVGLGNVTNDAQITKATLTAKGSIIAASAASTPAEITVGTDGKYLKADSSATGGVSWDTPAGSGTGDVIGPATHAASYVPMWNATPNSKTLVEGKALTGTDAKIVSGTAGTSGHLASWDANGDVIGAGYAPTVLLKLMGSLPTSANWNDYTEMGIYAVASASTHTNAAGSYGTLQVINNGQTYIRQEFWTYQGSTKKTRYFYDGTTWTAWA